MFPSAPSREAVMKVEIGMSDDLLAKFSASAAGQVPPLVVVEAVVLGGLR